MLLRGVLLGSATAALLLAACGSSKLAGRGGECFVATDCQDGLVCVEQEKKNRICTDDLSRAAGRLPPEASVPDTGAEAGDAGEPAEAAAEIPDTGPG